MKLKVMTSSPKIVYLENLRKLQSPSTKSKLLQRSSELSDRDKGSKSNQVKKQPG